MSWPKQQRMITAIQDPSNWLDSGKPDAILFSGGGNDVAGDQFAVFLDYAGFVAPLGNVEDKRDVTHRSELCNYVCGNQTYGVPVKRIVEPRITMRQALQVAWRVLQHQRLCGHARQT
jgi:hypothetical protein